MRLQQVELSKVFNKLNKITRQVRMAVGFTFKDTDTIYVYREREI